MAKLTAAIARQRGVCLNCGEPITIDEATMDHIVPRFYGGSNSGDNIGASHHRCNGVRGHAPVGMKRVIVVVNEVNSTKIHYEHVPIRKR